MRRSSFRLSIATLLILSGCAAALAFVSGSNAGAGSNSTLQLFPHPPTLTASTQTATSKGFVKAAFTAAAGPQTGAATHVVITVTLDPALVFDQANSSTGCSPDLTTLANDVVCVVGTVNPGETANRFVTFTAPTVTGTYPISGSATQDNGGGGNGSVNPVTAATQVNVVAAGDPNNAGNCLFNPGNVHTPAPTASTIAQTNQSTGADVGTVASTLGIPCAYADVGEDAPPAGFVTAISHDNIAQLTGPTTITITLASLPIPFSQIVWQFLAGYPASLVKTPIKPCVNGQFPPNASVCQLSADKVGRGGIWKFLQVATGSDPGYGA
jgi:hypothetical protein